MTHNFQITALDKSEFKHFFAMEDSELLTHGIRRMIVDEKPGYPCRVSLQDAEIGEEVLLVSYPHHNVNSPYKGNSPIFIRKSAKRAKPAVNEIPLMLHHRLLSVRGYDKYSMLQNAVVIEGNTLRETIHRMFTNTSIDYLHIHNAKPGCYNCSVKRV